LYCSGEVIGASHVEITWKMWFRTQTNILIVGLDNCGRPAIERKLKSLSRPCDTILPWIRSDANFQFVSFNLFGQDSCRILYRHYFSGLRGLIFVVDSSDRAKLDDARDELHLLLAEEDLDGVVLLVIANKQDVVGAMTANEVAWNLELEGLSPRPWHIQACSAITGNGLQNALEWLKTACATSACKATLQTVPYLPGDYTAHVKLRVCESPGDSRVQGYVARGTSLHIQAVAHSRYKRHWSYGFIQEPLNGWVLIGATGSGEHARQHRFLVSLSCIEQASGTISVQCNNLAGEEVAVLELDDPMETVLQFRARVADRVAETTGQPSAELSIVTSDGQILENCEGATLIKQALVQTFSDVNAVDGSEPVTVLAKQSCVVQ